MSEIRREQAQALLHDIRNDLDITWEDAALDNKLSGAISRGMNYLDTVAGGAQDYAGDTLARALLTEYCRYAMDGGLHDFPRNYQAEILMLRQMQEVSAYAPEQGGEGI